jgi:hypothetical protein
VKIIKFVRGACRVGCSFSIRQLVALRKAREQMNDGTSNAVRRCGSCSGMEDGMWSSSLTKFYRFGQLGGVAKLAGSSPSTSWARGKAPGCRLSG